MYSLGRPHVALLGKSCGQCWPLNARCWKPLVWSFSLEDQECWCCQHYHCPEQTRTQCFSDEPLVKFEGNQRKIPHWKSLGDIHLLTHPALLLCCPAWNTVNLGGFKFSKLTLESKGPSPLPKDGNKCWFSPLLFNVPDRAVYTAFATYDLTFIKTPSIPMHCLMWFFWAIFCLEDVSELILLAAVWT